MLRSFFVLLFLFILKSCSIVCEQPEPITAVAFRFSDPVEIIPTTITNNIHAILFTNDTTAYMSDNNGNVYKSTDTGLTFTRMVDFGSQVNRDMAFRDEQTILSSGDINYFFISYDAGLTWTELDIPDSLKTVERINYYPSTNELFLIGGSDVFLGVLYYSPDFGVTWQHLLGGPNTKRLIKMERLSALEWLICAHQGHMYRTKDGGKTWSLMDIDWGTLDSTNMLFCGLDMVNESIGYVTGTSFGFIQKSQVFKTTDGGYHWYKLPIPTFTSVHEPYLYSLVALNESEVIVAGGDILENKSMLMYTRDGGANWTIDTTIVDKPFIQDIIIKNNVLYGVGNNGLVFRKGKP